MSLSSFHREEGLALLGAYTPGTGAVVLDPFRTGAASPDAIAHHELQHQSLSINTTFGFFTQLLISMARRGVATEILRQSFELQWPVQELAATYAEMSFLAVLHPDLFRQEVRGLPSARLNQPPYREVFDQMDQLLRVDPAKPREVLAAQTALVGFLTAAAMNSDCLLRMAAGPVAEATLLACLQDSPDTRLEQIVRHLVAKNSFDALLKASVAQFAGSKDPSARQASLIALVYSPIAALVPEVSIQPDAGFRAQCQQALSTWNPFFQKNSGFSVSTKDVVADPLPRILETDGDPAASPPKLPLAALRQRLSETTEKSLGLVLDLALREPGEAFVLAQSYFLEPGRAPHPIAGGEPAPGPLPNDIQGLMPTAQLLQALAAFPAIPHAIAFIDNSWERWYRVPGGRDRFQHCVRICRQTHLSNDDVRRNILAFDGLGEAAEFFVWRLKPAKFIGVFFNRRRPMVYGLQKLSTDFAVDLFSKICTDLKVPFCEAAREAVPHFDLLNMVAFNYAF